MRNVPPLIVPDINILVSGATISRSPPSQIMQLWRKGEIDIATSPPVVQRVEQVFNYPKVRKLTGWSDRDVQEFLNDFRGAAVMKAGVTRVNAVRDPEDNAIFACAIEAAADYIVSGDEKHILPVGAFQGIPVVGPREFLSIFKSAV